VSFKVTILGSGAAVPTGKRNPSSQYVECNDRHILIDCGEGTQMQIRKFGIKIQRINHILISHLHGDHFFGLVGLISTMHLLGRNKRLTIYGPVQLESIIRSQLEIGHHKLAFDIVFVPLFGNENKVLFDDNLIEISTFPLNHRIPTNGFLIKEKTKDRRLLNEELKGTGVKLEHLPKLKKGFDIQLESGDMIYFEDVTLPPKPSYSYAYCSDTAYYEPICDCISGATVLYHEATFTGENEERATSTFHSTAKQAALIAKKAKVNKLLLGHFSARYEHEKHHLEEATAVFKNVVAVTDGLTIDVSF
jgi:ribonuclease Z